MANPIQQVPPNVVAQVAHAPAVANVQHVEAVGHVEHLRPQLVITTSSGERCVLSLEGRLNEAEQTELKDLLETVPGKTLCIHDEMNPPRGVPTARARRLAELARIALGGDPISFSRGEKVFVAEGSFLTNYKVTDAFRDQAINRLQPADKKQVLIQYKCAEQLLDLRQTKLQTKLRELKLQLEQIEGQPPQPGHDRIKSDLKRQIQEMERKIQAYNNSIKENAVLTASAYSPLNLSTVSDVAAKRVIDDRTNDIKTALDGLVVHGIFGSGSNDANYEPRGEREGWIPLIPIGCSNTSIHDGVKQTFASDLAHETAARPKTASAEALYIELARLVAAGRPDVEIHEAIFGEKSNFPLTHLDAADREDLYQDAIALRDNQRRASDAIDPVNMTTAEIRQAVDAHFNP